MHTIGRIIQLQVQQHPLKSGTPRTYSPTGITQVDSLRLTPNGLIGLMADGIEMMDVHHAAHPQTRFREDNSLSLGFSHHYEAIRQRFGTQHAVGVAGENIIIEGEDTFADRVGILSQHSGDLIPLQAVKWAPPCTEFSQYLAGRPLQGAEQREALQFLSDGRRGYYALIPAEAAGTEIYVGDELITW